MRKLGFLLLFSIVSSNIFAALQEKALIFKFDKPVVVKIADGATESEVEQDILRAVENDAKITEFEKTVHTGGEIFYLGASDQNEKENSLVRSKLVRSTNAGSHSLSLTPIAPEFVAFNNVNDAKNPLYNARISQIGIARVGDSAWPIVVKTGDNNPDASNDGVYVVTNPTNGSMVFSVDCLNNADGRKLSTQPFAVTGNNASSWQALRVFAGVDQSKRAESCKGTMVGLGSTDNPGVAVLKFNTKTSTSSNACGEETSTTIAELVQVDNETIDFDDVSAAPIDKVAYDGTKEAELAKVHLAFFEAGNSTNAAITSEYDFHFDNQYNQLFVGIDQVGRVDNATEGGILSVVTAKLDSNDKLVVKPIVVGPRKGNFADDSQKHIVGFYTEQSTDLRAATKKVRVMHTTTGKDYLITVGGVAEIGDEAMLNTWVNALPILPPSHANPGRLAKTNGSDDFEPFDATDDLLMVDRSKDAMSFSPDEKKIVVGVDPRFIGTDDTDIEINCIDVVGNTVYVGVAGDNSMGEGSGIYASSALFNVDGLVRSWTPWQRVATSDKVHGCGIDKATGNFQFLTEDVSTEKILVKSTVWGKSETVVSDSNDNRKLTSVLNDIFPNGVYKLCNFNDESPGFNQNIKMSMMMAVGDSKVALIQTGSDDNGNVEPALDFVLNKDILVFDSKDLEKIGPLLSCAIQRENNSTNNGYLYVGGCNGCARLEDGSEKGWATDPGLNNVATVKDFTFNEIGKNGDFGEILALDASESFVFVMGRKKFAAFGLDKQVVAGSEIDVCDGEDMLITGELIVYGSTEGLFTLDPADNYKKTAITGIEGIPVELHYLSERRDVPSENGNLMVLAVDKDRNLANIYRFDVQGTVLTLVSAVHEPVELSGFRRHINPETSTIYHARSRSDDQSDFLDIKTVGGEIELDAGLTDRLELGANTTYLAQAPVRDTTSGGLVFAGDWGVRVNE